MQRSLAALLSSLCHVGAATARQLTDSAYTSDAPGDIARTRKVRMATLACSSVSLAASFVAFYWFFRMEKRFRHRLIILLLYGDLVRGIWYFLFAVISIVHGQVKTETKLCQSTGFLIQYGTETSDYAVLVIAVHNALQVFRPRTEMASDGLYPYRYYVYAGALLIPAMMAALAFINPHWGYLSQGAFCNLPIRPFWYRLALSWIPRYLIALIILGLAIAIYFYVGFEFKLYSSISRSVNESTLPTTAPTITQNEPEAQFIVVHQVEHSGPTIERSRRCSSVAHDIVASSHHIATRSSFNSGNEPLRASTLPNSLSNTLHGSAVDLPLSRNPSVRPPLCTVHSGQTTRPSFTEDNPDIPSTPSPRKESVDMPESPSPAPMPLSNSNQLSRQRARITRQLRLLFIYPLVYTLMWLIPFIHHCMMYKDKYVKHPPFTMRLLTTICYCSMGFVDCLIFSLREKPWRSIHRSSGTFWGSFAPWRHYSHGRRISTSTSTRRASILRDHGGGRAVLKSVLVRDHTRPGARRIKSNVRTSTSTNDYANIAAEQAMLRLELEREERMENLRARESMGRDRMEDRESSSSDEGLAFVGEDDEESAADGEKREKIDKGKGRAVIEEKWNEQV